MIVVGIDQGLATCGYAIIQADNDNIDVLKSGTITTNSKYSTGRRLFILREKIKNLIIEHNAAMIGCERLFFNAPSGGRNKSMSMMQVNMATGVIHLLSNECGIDVFEYPPTTVKKMITGNGKASKEDVDVVVKEYVKHDTKTDHETDAIAIGITAYLKYREEDLEGGKNKGNSTKNKTSQKRKSTKISKGAETSKGKEN